jgi:hypothetical protein
MPEAEPMDWPGIVILLGVVAAAMLGSRIRGRLPGSDGFGRDPRRPRITDRPYREASSYRTSGALPRWRD